MSLILSYLYKFIPAILFVVSLGIDYLIFSQITDNDKISTGWKTVIGILLVPISVGGVFFAQFIGTFTADGDLQHAQIIQLGGQERLLAFSDVGQGVGIKGLTSHRVQSINLATGETITQSSLGQIEFISQVGDIVWLYDGFHDLEAVDPLTLTRKIDQAQIIKQNPSLSKGISLSEFYVDNKNNLGVSTVDGYAFLIDPKTFQTSPISQAALGKMEALGGGRSDNGTENLTEDRIALSNGTKLSISGDPRAKISPLPGSDADFISGMFLADELTHRAIELKDPSSVLVFHQSLLDEEESSWVSRVSLVTGKVLWQTQVVDPESDHYVAKAHLVGDSLTLILDNEVKSLNLADGSIKWTVHF